MINKPDLVKGKSKRALTRVIASFPGDSSGTERSFSLLTGIRPAIT